MKTKIGNLYILLDDGTCKKRKRPTVQKQYLVCEEDGEIVQLTTETDQALYTEEAL